MRKSKILCILLILLITLSSCKTNQQVKNEITNSYVEWENNITVNNIEDALTTATSIAKQTVIGVKSTIKAVVKTVETGSAVIIKRNTTNEGDYLYFAITNRHVVDSTNPVDVEVYLGENLGYHSATVNYVDQKVDVALISFFSPYLLGVANISKNELKEGAFAIAIGSPYDLELYYNTITIGSISSVKRIKKEYDKNDNVVYNEYIQHSATLNKGNSGGGLFNIYGELVGINCWKITGTLNNPIEGMSFAIPINIAYQIIEKYLF